MTKSSAATVAAGENAGALTEAIGDAFTACTYQLGQYEISPIDARQFLTTNLMGTITSITRVWKLSRTESPTGQKDIVPMRHPLRQKQ